MGCGLDIVKLTNLYVIMIAIDETKKKHSAVIYVDLGEPLRAGLPRAFKNHLVRHVDRKHALCIH